MLVSENLDVLRRNGFELILGDSNEDTEDEQSEQVFLSAQPVSKDTVFDFRGEYVPVDRPSISPC